MSEYGAFSDDFYVNMNLGTEMELPKSRESVLHYFEQIRRRYPRMMNFYSRDKNEFVLEEEKEAGAYRWASIESRRINSGVVNPETFESACEQHRAVLDLVPYELSVTPLDCESLSVMVGFDFTYKGNHNEVLCEAIGLAPGLERFAAIPGTRVLSSEPAFQFALDEECRTQCRVSFESRTNAFQVRANDYPEDQLSVYLTVRRYDSLGVDESYVSEYDRLASLCRELVEDHLIQAVLRPLQRAISLR